MARIKAVIFDFGGVLAEEGFRTGLTAIAEKNRLNPDDFFKTAEGLIYETGYVTGRCDESHFWNSLREKSGITASDEELREEILKRFRLRPEMMEAAEDLKSSGLIVAVLSDQTNWLEEINKQTPFSDCFDYIFNSFRTGKSKRDPSLFTDVSSTMGLLPGEMLFVDDNIENIKRASGVGLKTIHFRSREEFEKRLADLRQD
ncbi:MAG TPA: HAD family phosphatase [Thermodesulfovibrionales bacterium]|nr:HAD family phosphatase [Thermodesulfovibrionales bacterium]